jgi:hypothetical protein
MNGAIRFGGLKTNRRHIRRTINKAFIDEKSEVRKQYNSTRQQNAKRKTSGTI